MTFLKLNQEKVLRTTSIDTQFLSENGIQEELHKNHFDNQLKRFEKQASFELDEPNRRKTMSLGDHMIEEHDFFNGSNGDTEKR